MSNILEQASLVLVPSGYKAGKVYSQIPLDGEGDLQFTRSNDTATRVNSSGLIEKVRTNLVLQSNTFNTSWTISGTGTVTTGATDPFGGTTAWTLAKTAANTFLFQSTSSFLGSNTFSIYAKAGTVDQLWLNHAQSGAFSSFFDLTLGTTFGSAGCVPTIVSVGGGWFRCSIAGTVTSPINMRIYPASGGAITGTTGNILIYAAQGETGDIATDYIPTTTTAVSVGMTANVPRLDYSGGGCPKLLLEPQRTNLVTFSEQFNDASWTKEALSVTANDIESPDGTQNADLLTANGLSGRKIIYTNLTTIGGQSYSLSIYAKKGTNNFIQVAAGFSSFGANVFANFDLDTGVVGSIGSSTTASIQSVGDSWYRCTIIGTGTTTTTSAAFLIAIVESSTSIRLEENTLDTSVYLWGAQVEAGSYATSYIPTLAAAVTRGADACSKTGISSLIGQTEGTMFVEFDIPSNTENGDIIAIRSGTSSANGFFVSYRSASVVQLIVRTSSTNALIFQRLGAYPIGKNKLAVAYKNGDFAISLNGTAAQVNTSTITMPTSLDAVSLFSGSLYTQTLPMPYAQALIFPTRLSNTQLQELTTL